ncbi:MAG: hypothetical protein KBT47_02850 [Armatimonadetes bacterium]|nr:hypothetical protein [Candidatus Hippobium faecium]
MKVKIVDFTELPIHDTTWALCGGCDGEAYVGACCEHTGGVNAVVLRYKQDGTREALMDMGDVAGQPADNGRATQCKVHDSLFCDRDGLLYAATHLSGPPVNQIIYNPWGNWKDNHVSFPGAVLAIYDTKTDTLISADYMYEQEGCRALALDYERKKLYSCTYPLNHFHVWDIEKKQDTDYGRVGAVNPICIWTDSAGNGYHCDDFGRVIKFNADTQKLEFLDAFTTYPKYQGGWHNVSYDIINSTEKDVVYGVSWNAYPHLWQFDMKTEKVMDLGPIHQNMTGKEPPRINNSHVAGLCMGPDNKIYMFGMTEDHDGNKTATSHTLRYTPETEEWEDLGPLVDDRGEKVWYISRAVWISKREIVGAIVGRVPTGVIHIIFDENEIEDKTDSPFPTLRTWG